MSGRFANSFFKGTWNNVKDRNKSVQRRDGYKQSEKVQLKRERKREREREREKTREERGSRLTEGQP